MSSARAALYEMLAEHHEGLSPREIDDVLPLLIEGLTDQEIGDELDIAASTVRTHVERIRGKLGAHSRAQIMYIAIMLGLIVVDEMPARQAIIKYQKRIKAALDGYAEGT